jgi:hypothetical protein
MGAPTRHLLFGAHLVEDFVPGASPAFAHLFKALANGFVLVGERGEVEQAL